MVLFLLCLLLGDAVAANGGVVEGRLLSRSTSGKTVLFNVGTISGLGVNDFGVVMRRMGEDGSPGLRLVPVAKARVVQAGPGRSVWMLYKVFDGPQLVVGDPYLLTTEKILLKGRRDLKNDHPVLVDEPSSLPATANSKQRGDRDHLALRGADYRVLGEMHGLDERWGKDGALYGLDAWVTVGKDGKQKYARALWRSPLEDEFQAAKRLEIFEKVVLNYLRKANQPGFNYATFYAEQMDDGEAKISDGGTFRSEYKAFLDNQRLQGERDAAFHKEVLAKGGSWSADYSDEELASVMAKVGEEQELERRQAAMVLARSWQLAGGLGLNLLDNENRADAVNSRKAKWNAEALLEWFPAPRHVELERLGAWVSARYVQDGVSVGNLNARATETSLAAGFDWHFLRSPFTVGQNIPFLGIGVRTGVATLQIPTTGEKATYTAFSAPLVVGGVKYHFRSGWGLRVAGSMEKLQLEQSSSGLAGGDLPGRTEILDGRLAMALTKFY